MHGMSVSGKKQHYMSETTAPNNHFCTERPRSDKRERTLSAESRRPACNEGGLGLLDTVRKREPEFRYKELLNIGSADVISLLNLNHTQDLLLL